jgi:hypothetical protein
MGIGEIVSFYVNESLQTLEVTFRLLRDFDDVVRIDQISLEDVEMLGYDFESKLINQNYEDDDDFDEEYDEVDINDDDIKTFLEEYYFDNKNKLPKPELF